MPGQLPLLYAAQSKQEDSQTVQRGYGRHFDLYSAMVHAATDYVRANDKTPEKERDVAWQGATRAQACDAVRPVLPVATTSTVGIFASGQALESLIMHLQSDPLEEARATGKAC